MDKKLKLYKITDDIEVAFPNDSEQLSLSSFDYTSQRMGNAPVITGTIMHGKCLDDYFSDIKPQEVFVVFNEEKYYLKNTPTSSFSNTDARYKHDVEFVSERTKLSSVYFYDVVSSDVENDKPVSNSSVVTFSGNIREFAARLNYSLQYAKLQTVNDEGIVSGYNVVVDDDVSADEYKLVSFSNQYFEAVLQQTFELYGVPYYFRGKTIHFGWTDKESVINETLKYGKDNSLLSITKSNANNQIINRCTGIGSSDNISFYYPNNSELGELDYTLKDNKGNILNDDFFVKNYNVLAKSIEVDTTYQYYDTTNYIDMEVLGAYFCKKEGDSPTTAWEPIPYGDDHIAFATYINIKTYGGVAMPTFHHYRIDFKIKAEATVNLTFKTAVTTPTQDGSQFFFDLSDARFVRLFKGEYSPTNYAIKTLKTSGDNISFHLEEPDVYSLEVFDIDVTKIYPTLNNATCVPLFFNVKNISTEDRTQEWRNENGHTFRNLKKVGLTGDETKVPFGSTLSTKVLFRVAPQTNLMPYIYRESLGKERFYNAENNKYTDENGEYYEFANTYIESSPKEHIQEFNDIKPSIEGVINAAGLPINVFTEFAYDENDNDEWDGEKAKHPYFYGKLRKMDGEFGLNIFDYASEEDEMTISMIDGSCSACQFKIAVDTSTQKNMVQVDENGNLKRDSNGDVLRGTPQDVQNDTKNNEVWVALIKDNETFNTLMPNATLKPSTGDKFVILHIELPREYVWAAEQKLTDAIIKHMAENNDEQFKFSIKFSRIYLAENPDVLKRLNENSTIRFEYNGVEYFYYVSSFSYRFKNDEPLPEINVELSDTITSDRGTFEKVFREVNSNVIYSQQQATSELKMYMTRSYIPSNSESTTTGVTNYENGIKVSGNLITDVIKSEDAVSSDDEKVYSSRAVDEKIKSALENVATSDDYLSKTKEDVAQKKIVFKEGIGIGDGVILWDSETSSLHVQKFDGTPAGLWTESFLSAKGRNPSTGSSSGGAGALYQLADVAADGQQVSGAATGALLMYNGTQWQGVSQSEIVPNLTGYAKESWVLSQGFLTEHQDLSDYAKKSDIPTIPADDINKGVTAYGWGDHSKVGYLTSITSALVTGALGFTPFDEDSFTKANIKSTLGISDWALASSKPSYTTSEVTEGANLYFTNARAVAALKSITDGLGSDISTLQGYFTNGVAKSAARLSTNTVYKAWGQTFFENGVPKAVSGALTDVTDITSSGTITTNKIVIGDGAIEWDSENKGFKIVGGLYTESYLSAKGANSSGSSSSGGQYTRLDEWTNYSSAYDTWVLSAKLGKGLYDTQNSLLTRIGALEGKATNVSFTQSLTSGTQIGSISIDGVTKNIYAPTIPTADINKGVTAYGWGNHANAGYLTQHQDLSGYQTKITSSNKLSYSLISGTPTIPTALKSPYALTFGSKTYDGSAAKTIVASDLGALTAHQTIYALTIKNSAGTTQLTYTPNSAVGSLTLTKAMVGLGNVENTALSTWAGTNKITTLGTITTGVWNGTKIANSYLANSAITIAGTSVSLGSSITAATLQSNLGLGALAYKGSLAFSELTGKPTTISGYGITDGVTAGAINSADSILTWAQSNPSYIGSINSGGWSNIISVRHRNNQGDGVSYGMLLYSPLTSNGALKYRQQASGKWQDERTILDNISYTDYTYSKSTIDTKLGGYLPLSGGTLSNEAFGGALTINRSGNYDAVIKYSNGNGLLGYIGIGSTREPYFTIDAAKLYTLIHEGNIGSQSVASAAKLTTARTIWGQSFDGTGNVSGVLSGVTALKTDGDYGVWKGNLFSTALTTTDLAYNATKHIFYAGNVGIGTTSPSQKLHVDGSIYAKGGSTNGGYALYWGTNKQYRIGSNDDNDFYIFDDNTSSKAKFRIGVAGADRLNILTNGNVLIGTTTDSGYKLDVNGTLHASDVVTLDKELIGNGWKISQHRSSDVLPFGLELHGDNKALGEIAYYQDHFIVGNFKNGIENSLINFYDNGNVTINPVTCFGIGTVSPQYTLDVNGVIHSNTGIFSDGYVSAKGQNTSSDMRLKNVLNDVVLNVKDIANAPSMRFSWKNGGGVDVGSIAQYWQNVLPDAVKERDGRLEMQYANIALLSAIAIAKRVETHEERIERLEREVKELRIEN